MLARFTGTRIEPAANGETEFHQLLDGVGGGTVASAPLAWEYFLWNPESTAA